jgi:hypothetical protein
LIEIAAKYYAQASAIIYEFTDSEFIHLWNNIWETKIGESDFLLGDDYNSGQN